MKVVRFLMLLFCAGFFLFACFFVITSVRKSGYGLSYQVSASMPEGWYLLQPVSNLKKGEVVVFEPPHFAKKFLQVHHWLPDNGVMMKHVMGVPGDFVCKHNGAIFLDHHRLAKVYRYYEPGKLLPTREFCGKVPPQHYLLMSTTVENSYDGRYFGLVDSKSIFGEARKL